MNPPTYSRDSGATPMRLAPAHFPTCFDPDFNLADGIAVTIRPIRPDDEPLVIRFHEGLSERTVYLRYFYYFGLDRRTNHERLRRNCLFDCDSEMAFVAERFNSKDWEIVGVGRLSRSASAQAAEVSLVVTDAYQGCGLGSTLVSRLVTFARELSLHHLTASVLRENSPMRRIFKKVGFEFEPSGTSEVLEARLLLVPPCHQHLSPREGGLTSVPLIY